MSRVTLAEIAEYRKLEGSSIVELYQEQLDAHLVNCINQVRLDIRYAPIENEVRKMSTLFADAVEAGWLTATIALSILCALMLA